MKNTLLIIFLFITTFVNAQTGKIQGTVIDKTGEPMIFAAVVFKQNGIVINGTQTDFDGKYRFDSLAVGTYDIEVRYVGFPTKTISDIIIFEKHDLTLNVEMMQIEISDCCCITIYDPPLIDVWNTTQGTIFKASDIQHSPHKN